MKMRSAFLELLHKDGETKINGGKTFYRSFLSRYLPQSRTANVNCYRLLLTKRHSACHVHLHKSTPHLLYKYCTDCTVCNWTVLTVITQKQLLHVQLHNSTAHLLYKYWTNCTICNWTVLTVFTQKLLLHVQVHNRRESLRLMSSE